MKAIKFTDTDGRKWRVWVRGWYQHKITGAKQLKELVDLHFDANDQKLLRTVNKK